MNEQEKVLLSAAVHLFDNAEEHVARAAEDDGWVVTKEDFEELQRCVQKARKVNGQGGQR